MAAMFERFSDGARRVVVVAQEESRRLGHGHIGAEHFLLALLHGDTAVSRALTDAGVTLAPAREQVAALVGQVEAIPMGHIPFTPEAKAVFEGALREALELGHDHIGAEHLLLGLTRDTEGAAAQVLDGLGVDIADLRGRVAGMTPGSAEAAPADVHVDPLREAVVRIAGMAGIVGTAEPTGGDQPRCGRCHAPAEEHLRARTVSATTEEGATQQVVVLWCGRCGAVLGTLPPSAG
jgi:ATP-dependent Clp protease ATP-binding subunit ClpA